MVDYKKQGKKNRRSGSEFERRVRKDLEKKGWVVSKWMNNVEFKNENSKDVSGFFIGTKAIYGKLVPAKRKYNPFRKALSVGNGFPDFIIYRMVMIGNTGIASYEVYGVECKKGKYLDKEEKLRCEWMIKNKIFNEIWIAYAGKKKGEIIYKEWKSQ